MLDQMVLYRTLIEKVQEAAKIRGVNPVGSLLLLNEVVKIIRQIYESYEVESLS